MIANDCDRGNHLEQHDQEMIIIFKGNLVITTSFDGGPQMVVEYI